MKPSRVLLKTSTASAVIALIGLVYAQTGSSGNVTDSRGENVTTTTSQPMPNNAGRTPAPAGDMPDRSAQAGGRELSDSATSVLVPIVAAPSTPLAVDAPNEVDAIAAKGAAVSAAPPVADYTGAERMGEGSAETSNVGGVMANERLARADRN